MTLSARGGVAGVIARPDPLARKIWLLQRKTSKPGKGLGKTTGWIHRLSLSQRGVQMLAGVEYRRLDSEMGSWKPTIDGHLRVEGKNYC